MTNLKCIRCGTLTTDTSQICKICEIELNPIGEPPLSTGSVLFSSYQPAAGSNDYSTKSTTIRPFHGVGDVLTPTLVLFIKHFWLITKLSIVIVAPFEIFKALNLADIKSDWQLSAGLYVLGLMCSVLIAPALTYALIQTMQTGSAPGINESYRWGFTKLGKLTVAAAISWIGSTLGFMLCIIPGVFIALSLSLVFPIAILEKGSAWDAIQSSSELTKRHRGNIFLAYLVIFLVTLLFGVPAKLLGEYLGATNSALWPLQAAAAIFSDVIAQSNLVFSLVTYLSIRALWSQSAQG